MVPFEKILNICRENFLSAEVFLMLIRKPKALSFSNLLFTCCQTTKIKKNRTVLLNGAFKLFLQLLVLVYTSMSEVFCLT